MVAGISLKNSPPLCLKKGNLPS